MNPELDIIWNQWVIESLKKEQRDSEIIAILKTTWSTKQIKYLMGIRKLYQDMINLIENDDVVYRVYSYFGTDLVVINNRPITKEELLNIGFLFIRTFRPIQ
tara:strand:- start:215 stop:520 length:306 start_codon:yes stop_codon:yes gene_type:complete